MSSAPEVNIADLRGSGGEPYRSAKGRNNNKHAEKRDEKAKGLLSQHAATPSILVSVGIYPNNEKAGKRLNVMEKRGIVRVSGIVREEGRHVQLWTAGQAIPPAKAQHEYEVTLMAIRLFAAEVRRGWNVDEYAADLDLRINGQWKHLEHDRGGTGYRALMERFDVYADCPNDVLWVFSTEARKQGAIKRSQRKPGEFWFTTFEQAVRDPHAPDIWCDREGHTTTLEKDGGSTAEG